MWDENGKGWKERKGEKLESQDFDDFRQVLDKQICYTLIFRSLRSLPLPYKYQDL